MKEEMKEEMKETRSLSFSFPLRKSPPKVGRLSPEKVSPSKSQQGKVVPPKSPKDPKGKPVSPQRGLFSQRGKFPQGKKCLY
jgi:hypothetical protein